MRIAIVINTSWNIYNFRLNLAKAIQEAGHTIIAIAPKDDYTQKLIDFGFEYVELPLDNKGTNPIKELFQVKTFISVYKKANPDFVLQYTIKPNIYGSIAAKRLGIKAINNVSGLGTVFITENFLTKIAQSLYRFSFQFPKKVFFQNSDDREEFLKRKLVSVSKTDVLPGSGVNLTQYEVLPFRRNETFTFLMLSRLLIDKGIREFFEACEYFQSKNYKAKFVLCGKVEAQGGLGISQEELNTVLSTCKNIIYKGHVDNVKTYIQDSDCVILPSYREGTPKSLLEAIACGKPIVTTNAPGCKEVVKDAYNGFLCEVKSSESLIQKLEKMYFSSDEELQQMSRNSRQYAEEKFDEKIVIQKYLDAISQLS